MSVVQKKKAKTKTKIVKQRKEARAAQGKKTTKKTRAPKPIGVVTHFYGGIGVAIIKFTKPVKQGEQVAFRGATTDFVEAIGSMQYDHRPISVAPAKKEIGVKVNKRVREGDSVYPA